ncbi:MAG: metalloprotease [Bacteroidetes bacterium]|nr:MAG: metalloprotease [Bacteroidota bacterium]
MRWQGRKGSQNIEDRRGGRAKKVGAGLGIGSILIIVLALFMGEDPSRILQQVQGGQMNTPATETTTQAPNDELGQFVSVVLKETEDVWKKLFREQLGREYQEPTLVLFDGQTQSACGFASKATGPFYCPGDQKLYIDLSFYRDLKERFKAPGDFAMAYVVAHEVAHHVQYLLGITRQVDSQRGRISKKAFNDLSVRLELQADFLAGVWANHAQRMHNILEEGDIEEALRAANAIGDDRIQMQTRGYVVPDSFTHGTSEQRMRWFTKGVKTGDLRQGDTFAAEVL